MGGRSDDNGNQKAHAHNWKQFFKSSKRHNVALTGWDKGIDEVPPRRRLLIASNQYTFTPAHTS